MLLRGLINAGGVVKTVETSIMVERVVTDIDETRAWSASLAGKARRPVSVRSRGRCTNPSSKYKLHADEELSEKAYRYIRQYY